MCPFILRLSPLVLDSSTTGSILSTSTLGLISYSVMLETDFRTQEFASTVHPLDQPIVYKSNTTPPTVPPALLELSIYSLIPFNCFHMSNLPILKRIHWREMLLSSLILHSLSMFRRFWPCITPSACHCVWFFKKVNSNVQSVILSEITSVDYFVMQEHK